MNAFRKLAFGATALVATTIGFAAATPVLAAEPVAVRIATSDLNLSSHRGRQALALRVDRAADAVCTGAASGYDVRARKAARRCKSDVIAQSKAAIAGLGGSVLAAR